MERGERGAPGALKAVRNLTFQLSGAQLGITVTNLVVGMLAEPSIAKLIAGPLEAAGCAALGVALGRAGHRHGPVDRRPDGRRRAGAQELGDLLAAARGQAGGDPAALVQRRVPPVHHPPQQHRQPSRAPLRYGARRGAGLRARPAGAGRPGPALRQGGRPGGGHRRAVRAHPEPRRPDRGERDDAARPGHRPGGPGDLRGRGERDPGHRACPASPSTAAASTRSSASSTSRTCWPCPPSAALARPRRAS